MLLVSSLMVFCVKPCRLMWGGEGKDAPLFGMLSVTSFDLCPAKVDITGIKHFEGNEYHVISQHCFLCSLEIIHYCVCSSSWGAQHWLLGRQIADHCRKQTCRHM